MIEDRLLRAARYVEQHLDEDLTVDVLAREGCISSYHFHRLFRLWTGEPVMEYVRRVRLEHAAYRLRGTRRTIGDIARSVGYRSVDAFGRAFRAHFGCAPRDYRRSWLGTNSDLAPTRRPPPASGAVAGVSLLHLPSWHLVCMRHLGPYQQAGRAWSALAAWAADAPHPVTVLGRFGISHDDPELVTGSRIRYDACYAVPGDEVARLERSLSGSTYLRIMPAAEYAATVHRGAYHLLGNAYRRLFIEWLPGSGRLPGDAPVVERYLNSPLDTPEDELLTQLLLPLHPSVAAQG